MLNVYDHHNNPELIYGYTTHNKTQLLSYETAAELLVNRTFKEHSKDDLLAHILSSADGCYEYAAQTERRFPRGEHMIATDARISVEYALDILDGPFKLGEPKIATSALASYEYASNVLGGPFKLGEPKIATSADESLAYAVDILGGPFKLGEPAIKSNAPVLVKYNEFIKSKGYPTI